MKKTVFLLFLTILSLASIGHANTIEFTYSSNVSVNQTKNDITINISKGTGSADPAYYSNGMRVYGGNTITVNASYCYIQEIKFTIGSSTNTSITSSPTGYNQNSYTWTGEANGVTFYRGNGSGYFALQKVTVTYADKFSTYNEGGIVYKIVGGTEETEAWVQSLEPSNIQGNLSIPDKLLFNNKELAVTKIMNWAFDSCSGLTSVEIPNSVTEIGNNAFFKCSGLKSLIIGNSITEIGNSAFNGCTSLSSLTFEEGDGSIKLGNSSDNVGLFADCPLENIYIGKDLSFKSGSSYGYSPFANIKTLSKVTIGKNVTSLPDYLLYWCSGLTSIIIPNSVSSIGKYAFNGCSSLKAVTFELGESSIELNYNRYSSTSNAGKGLFADCPLENIYIGRNLSYNSDSSYGYSPFANISTLTEVTIGDNVTSLPDYLLYGCSGLTGVIIPTSISSIGNNVFRGCTGLSEVYISNLKAWCNIDFENYYSNPLYYTHRLYLNNEEITYLTIPEGVSSIKNYAFDNCSSITSVSIPNTVTSIGISAFYGCSGLTSVTIGNSITEIGNDAFNNCTSLTSVTIGNSVASIGNNAFSHCNIETLNIDCKSIKSWFNELETLKTLTIGNSVNSIGNNAFSGCSTLTSVKIPNSVTTIGSYVFNGCSSLNSITFEDGQTLIKLGYNSDGKGLFGDCPLETLYIGRNLSYNSESSSGYSPFGKQTFLTKVTIGKNVTSLPDYLLYGCSGLTSVIIPNSVTSIGVGTFFNCSSLISVEIPNSVTSIGDQAFEDCSGLTSFEIPNSVTSIGNYAFNGCNSLKALTFIDGDTPITLGYNKYTTVYGKGMFDDCPLENIYLGRNLSYNTMEEYGRSPFAMITTLTAVTISNNVTSLPDYLLFGCTDLRSVDIPNSITYIGNYAFSICISLTSIEIPNSVISIRNYAFSNCSGLTNVEIPNSVLQIGNSAFYNCRALPSIEIPNSVISIEEFAFEECVSLTEVIIDDGRNNLYLGGNSASPSPFGSCPLEKIYIGRNFSYRSGSSYDYSPFAEITTLTDVTIGDNVTSLPNYFLYNCNGLTSVTIPNSVTEIGNEAFSGCNLAEIELLNTTPPSYYSSFSGYSNFAILVIPDNTLSSYLATDWKSFLKIEEANGDKAYIGNDDVFTYRFIESLHEATLVQDNSYKNMQNVSIPDRVVCELFETEEFYKVTSIGEGAFQNCDLMTNVKLPSWLVSINKSAFSGCKGLSSIDFPGSVTSIGEQAFENCSGLLSLTIPNSVTEIKSSAFSGCNRLASITIGNSITEIAEGAFNNCSGLTSVEISDLTAWCNINFGDKFANPLYYAGCLYLDNYRIIDLTIPEGVSTIKNYAFYNCSELKSVTIGNLVTKIESEAFNYCDGLTKVTIGNSVTSIGNYAFNYCRRLTSVTIGNSIIEMAEGAFNNCISLERVVISDLASWCNINFESISANPLYYAGHLYLENKEITDLTIPEGVSSIKNYTFSGCRGLARATIGNSVTEIERDAFSGCSGLTYITIGNSVTSIEEDAFDGCQGLQSLIFEDGIEDLSIESHIFDINTLYVGRNLSGQYSFPNIESLTFGGFIPTIPANTYNQSTLTSVTINPGAEVVIEDGAFMECSNLSELILPEDIAEIGANAFNGTGLKNIIVPGGVIADNAFVNCKLDNIILGANVESIGERAFEGNNNIKNVYATPTTPPAAQNNTFSYYEAQLWVPEEAIDTYYNFIRCWYRFNGKPLICPEKISVTGSAKIIGKPGETLQLSATISPSNVTLDRVLWSSTNPAIATVDNNGLVTIHNFQSSDEALSRAAEEGFCRIIATTLYEDSPIAAVNIELLTTSIEYINSEDMSTGSSSAFGQNDIYTLQGVCLKRQASQKDIDALNPGIYIIGGKKIIVR